MYVQMRMIACLAYMGGYDINSDQVQTLVYACLAGISIDQILKHTGNTVWKQVRNGLWSRKSQVKSSQKSIKKVGFRFLTKFGTKGIINIGKAVPIVGGVISGGFDFAETKIIANRAYKMFIKGDLTALSDSDSADTEIIQSVYYLRFHPIRMEPHFMSLMNKSTSRSANYALATNNLNGRFQMQ